MSPSMILLAVRILYTEYYSIGIAIETAIFAFYVQYTVLRRVDL
jgi:hypothetical protein